MSHVGKVYLVDIPVNVLPLCNKDVATVHVYAHSPEEAARRIAEGIERAVHWHTRKTCWAMRHEAFGFVVVEDGPKRPGDMERMLDISEEQADRIKDANEANDVLGAIKIVEEVLSDPKIAPEWRDRFLGRV